MDEARLSSESRGWLEILGVSFLEQWTLRNQSLLFFRFWLQHVVFLNATPLSQGIKKFLTPQVLSAKRICVLVFLFMRRQDRSKTFLLITQFAMQNARQVLISNTTAVCAVYEHSQHLLPSFCAVFCVASLFRPSATVSRMGLMVSRLCHCCGGPPPPPPGWLTPPRDGWLGRSASALTKRTCF